MQYYVKTQKQEACSTPEEGRSGTSFKKYVDTDGLNDGESCDRAQKKVPEQFVLFPSQEAEPERPQKVDHGHVRKDQRERIGLGVLKNVLKRARKKVRSGWCLIPQCIADVEEVFVSMEIHRSRYVVSADPCRLLYLSIFLKY